MDYQVTYETTPNPQSLKFLVSQDICEEILEISDREAAKRSPLAEKIMGFPWAKSLFLGKNFVTVTKEDWLEWDMIKEPLCDLIKEHLNEGGGVLLPKAPVREASDSSKDSEDVKKIKEVLERDIQPAVNMDGGFVQFVSYENGIVYLSLQGACSGCPSATVTLKQGIQTRLQQFVPGIKEVIDV